MKVGIGFDVHDFIDNRKLFLGGVEVEYHLGLNGHSDADVLIHAIIDSIVGVVFHKDIGQLFPDNDFAYKNIDSKILLKKVVKMLDEKEYKINNVDAVIIAQEPKLSKYIGDMRKCLADIMMIDIDDISIKATTTEHLGFVGRKEGIAVLSTATLINKIFRSDFQ